MNNTKKKLLLIYPSNQKRLGFANDDSTRFMPLGLGIVAALTPDNWEIDLIDENYEAFTFREADLVGLTGFTANAARAFEIAAIYREAGIPTVMGGIHATMNTDEVKNYVDTVFTGEAEGAWPQLLADFEAGNLLPLYEGGLTEVKNIPHARRDIYKYPYVYDLVQTTRGCPNGCEFCSVTQMCGRTYRERDIEDVLDELEQTTRPLVFFVDDNLLNLKKGAADRAIKLFKGMVARGIKKLWFSQAAMNFADNEEVLYWARKAGCMMILLGVEAETAQALNDVKKNVNLRKGVDSFEKIFSRFHKYGIGILGTMIFGMESDTKEDLYARRNFITRSGLDAYQCTILTPMPGTLLYKRMDQQNRIVINNYPDAWQDYHCMTATIDMPNISHTEIQSIMNDIWLSLYNKEALRHKVFKTFWRTRSLKTAYWTYASNHNYGRMSLEESIKSDPEGLDINFNWKNRKRSLYLKLTDKIIWLFYQVSWTGLAKRCAGRYTK